MPVFRKICKSCQHIGQYLEQNHCMACGNTAKFRVTYGKNGKIACGSCGCDDVTSDKSVCAKCGSADLERDIPRKGDAVASFVGERDWARNLTSSQVADYMTPDDRGNFLDPY